MPSIAISDELFARLQRYATPFVDTPETVILRALEALERPNGRAPAEPAVSDANGNPLQEFKATSPPNLTFTKVVSALWNGKAVKPANWNRLLDAAITYAAAQIGDFNKLRRIVAINIVSGQKIDEGYHFLEDAGLSVQGQDANGAWRSVMFIAQNLKASVEVSFIWRNKEGAEHAGKTGSMHFG
jgi:hypothetical protein